jgi:uncharacterized protein YlxP (DUF503 family)
MHVALLELDLHIPYAQSLKDKRMAVRSLKDRLRKRFNVSVAEVNHQDLWQRAGVGVVSVGPDATYLENQLALALEEVERSLPDCEVTGRIGFLK